MMHLCGAIFFGMSVFLARVTALKITKPIFSAPQLSRNKINFTRRSSTTAPDDKKEQGHQSGQSPELSEEEKGLMEIFKKHQSSAAKISMAEEVRTLIDQSLMYGVLSTNSDQISGYPTGSVVGFELDNEGMPFFVFSTMSSHTKDILKDGRASLTVLAKDFKGAAEGRVVIVGDIVKLFDEGRRVELREKYLKRHSNAYWIDFGDFSYFTMKSIELVRYVGGFAMAGSLTAEQYMTAKPDPLAAFAAPVMKHMNDDHADSTVAMVKHYVGVPCTEAEIVTLDRFGMTVKAKMELAGGGYAKIRLPFPREVTDRKAIKEVLVEMTKAASAH